MEARIDVAPINYTQQCRQPERTILTLQQMKIRNGYDPPVAAPESRVAGRERLRYSPQPFRNVATTAHEESSAANGFCYTTAVGSGSGLRRVHHDPLRPDNDPAFVN
jgi:hypothetical protein